MPTRAQPLREQPEIDHPITISVSIVTYHCDAAELHETLNTLASSIRFARQHRPLAATVYVVSNDDTDAHQQEVRTIVDSYQARLRNLACAHLIDGQGNIGYGAGHNLAIRSTSADYHLVLNPDVVLDESAILECLNFLDAHPEAAMCVPQAVNGRGDYAYLAKREPSVLVLLLRGLTIRPSESFFGRQVGRYIYHDCLPADEPWPVNYASGCYMFCQTSALRAVGGFDERYFLYFEDYDLSRRISQRGRIYELPRARIRHLGGYTAQQGWLRIARFARSACRFFRSYGWRLI